MKRRESEGFGDGIVTLLGWKFLSAERIPFFWIPKCNGLIAYGIVSRDTAHSRSKPIPRGRLGRLLTPVRRGNFPAYLRCLPLLRGLLLCPPPDALFLTRREAAALLRINIQLIDEMIRREKLPAYRPVGHRILLRREDCIRVVLESPVWEGAQR